MGYVIENWADWGEWRWLLISIFWCARSDHLRVQGGHRALWIRQLRNLSCTDIIGLHYWKRESRGRWLYFCRRLRMQLSGSGLFCRFARFYWTPHIKPWLCNPKICRLKPRWLIPCDHIIGDKLPNLSHRFYNQEINGNSWDRVRNYRPMHGDRFVVRLDHWVYLRDRGDASFHDNSSCGIGFSKWRLWRIKWNSLLLWTTQIWNTRPLNTIWEILDFSRGRCSG